MKPSDHNRNQKLVKKLKAGNKRSFEVLYYEYEPKLFGFAMKLTHNVEDAKEVVQDVFLKVWDKRNFLDPQLSFDSFLYTIARNLVYNKTKHKAYGFAYKEYMTNQVRKNDDSTENIVHYNELETLIQTACRELPPVRREVFMLSRMDGLSNKEIAQKLNTSISNVNNHIFKALLFLKKRIRMDETLPEVLIVICFFS